MDCQQFVLIPWFVSGHLAEGPIRENDIGEHVPFLGQDKPQFSQVFKQSLVGLACRLFGCSRARSGDTGWLWLAGSARIALFGTPFQTGQRSLALPFKGRDGLQELRSELRDLGTAHPVDRQQFAFIPRFAAGHLAEGPIGKDDISRHLPFLGQDKPQFPQMIKQGLVGSVRKFLGCGRPRRCDTG